MIQRFILTIISFAACATLSAQSTCTINGNITDATLDNGKNIKKVSLVQPDAYGRMQEIAKAKVKKGKYTIKYTMPDNAPVMAGYITGFGEGNGIELFIEPGTVTVNTAKATAPAGSEITGTATNDAFNEYKAIYTRSSEAVEARMAAEVEKHGKEWAASNEGKKAAKRINAAETIKRDAEIIKFLIGHNCSPMTPLEIERTLLPYLSDAYAEQMVKCISMELHGHPYYTSLRNTVFARLLKVGYEIPDVTLPLNDGTTKLMSDLRGRHILLDFWASDCAASGEHRESLKELFEATKEKRDEFVIVSIALDNNAETWKAAIKANGTDAEGWIHACECTGMESSLAAKYFKIDKTPRLVLVDPEGRLISLDMDIDEVQMRIEQILSGDLYYLDQEK